MKRAMMRVKGSSRSPLFIFDMLFFMPFTSFMPFSVS
jgi:hypothetical protein